MRRAWLLHSVERLVFSLLLTETWFIYSWSETSALFAHPLTVAVCRRRVRLRLRSDAMVLRLVVSNRKRPYSVYLCGLMIVGHLNGGLT
jgi:hypothetical protein